MKEFFVSMLLLLICFGCNGQNKTLEKTSASDISSIILNSKIKYSIMTVSCDTCVPIRNIGKRVIIQLTQNEQNEIRKLSKNDWIKLLSNKTSDFAANLILYSIYNKDAFRLSHHDNINEWRKYVKEDDIEFWQHHFLK